MFHETGHGMFLPVQAGWTNRVACKKTQDMTSAENFPKYYIVSAYLRPASCKTGYILADFSKKVQGAVRREHNLTGYTTDSVGHLTMECIRNTTDGKR